MQKEIREKKLKYTGLSEWMIKFEFKTASLSYDVKHIWHYLNPGKGDWDWSKYITTYYPTLRKGDSKEKVKKFVSRFWKENQKQIIKKMNRFKRIFERKSNSIVLTLMKILEMKTTKIGKITILISLCPINPYDLRKKEFSVYWGYPVKYMPATAIHEISHFLFFEKWLEIFPETKPKDLKPPRPIWYLSELVAPIILNDKRMRKIFYFPLKQPYKEFENLLIDGKPITKLLFEMYNKRKNFEDFVKKAYGFVLKHKKEILAA